MQHCKEVIISNTIHSSKTWQRKIDDSFAITYHSKTDTLTELNKINEKINYTVKEEHIKAISFLDCLISSTKETHL